MPPLRRRRAAWLPSSTMRPWSKTRMRSSSRTVDRRWAMTSVVRPRIRLCMASWIKASDSLSRLEVASSRIRIGALARNARASATRWRPPPPSLEAARAAEPCRRLDLGRRGARPAIGDVVGQRAMEQQRLLLHDRHLPSQALLADASDILPVDRDATAIEVVQPLHQLDEGRLARARPSGAGAAHGP